MIGGEKQQKQHHQCIGLNFHAIHIHRVVCHSECLNEYSKSNAIQPVYPICLVCSFQIKYNSTRNLDIIWNKTFNWCCKLPVRYSLDGAKLHMMNLRLNLFIASLPPPPPLSFAKYHNTTCTHLIMVFDFSVYVNIFGFRVFNSRKRIAVDYNKCVL